MALHDQNCIKIWPGRGDKIKQCFPELNFDIMGDLIYGSMQCSSTEYLHKGETYLPMTFNATAVSW